MTGKSNKKNIIQIYGHKTNYGGIVNFYRKLDPYFKKSQYNIHHFRIGSIQSSKFFSFPLIRFFDLLFSYPYFFVYCLIKRPALIHLNPSMDRLSLYREYPFIFIQKTFFPKVKIVTHFRGWDNNFIDNIERQKFNFFLLKSFLRNSDYIIVLANKFKNTLLQKFDNLCYIDIIATTTEVVDSIPERGHKKSNHVKLLYLARIVKEKGVEDIATSLRYIKNEKVKTNIKVIFAGNGEAKKDLEKTVAGSGLSNTVEFIDYVSGEAKRHTFEEADIFVFPSYYKEGCPNSVIESMAFGLPVICTQVGALEDIIENNVNGIIVPPQAPAELAKAIEYLCLEKEIRLQMGAKNYQIAKSNFTPEITTKRIIDIYTNLINQ